MKTAFLIGNVGHAASVRQVAKRDGSGSTPVVNFSIAVKDGFGDLELTEWWDCSWWGPRAEKVAAWLTKGRQVHVQGVPGIDKFMKKDSTRDAKLVLKVTELTLLAESRGNAGGQAAEADPAMVPGGRDGAPKEDGRMKREEDVPY